MMVQLHRLVPLVLLALVLAKVPSAYAKPHRPKPLSKAAVKALVIAADVPTSQ